MRSRTVFATLFAGLLFAAAPVTAELTAERLWADWQGAASDGDIDLKVGSETSFGNTLTLRDVVLNGDLPQNNGPISISIPELRIRNADDNTVEILVTANQPIAIETDDATFDLSVSQTAQVALLGETDGRRDYSLDSPQFDATVENLVVKGRAADLDAALSIRGITAAFSSLNDGQTFEPEEAAFARLELAVEDSLLTGNGGVDFENAAYASDPVPVGQMNFQIKGFTKLLNQLVDENIISGGDALGVMLVIGFYAQPGPGTDVLESQIDFDPDGSISVNGQRVR